MGSGVIAAGVLAFGPSFWSQALAAESLTAGDGPYGPLGSADGRGLKLPDGFESRIVARSNALVEGTAYRWPVFPDGQATFATDDGGWILATNSESLSPEAGSSAIRFDSDGNVRDAYRILAGTNANCAGGPTPWGTWLSCEEYDSGRVWECDPARPGTGIVRPAMGSFSHEAVAVDPDEKRLYMTEDEEDGAFYRFTPRNYPDRSSGLLEVAVLDCGQVSWERVPDPLGVPPTREQVDDAARFDGGEGIWFDSGVVYFSTKGDNVIRAYDVEERKLGVVYDRAEVEDAPLSGLDNLTVADSGDLYVCEDGGDMDIGIITPDGEVARFLKLTGPDADGSEMAGVIFNPEGDRMYFSSQRGDRFGITYEVRGPFRDRNESGPRGPVLSCGDPTGEDGGTDDDDPDRSDGDIRRGGGEDGQRGGSGRDGGERSGSGGGGGGGSDGDDDASEGVLGPPGPDVDAPGITTFSRSTVSLGALLDDGMVVKVVVDEPGEVKAVLRTGDLARVAGARGSTPRPRTLTLARGTVTAPVAGEYRLRLRTGRRTAARLSSVRRSLAARLTVQATDRAGNVAVASRRVRVPARR